MELTRRTSTSIAVATAALTLALGGIAFANPMGSTGNSMGTGITMGDPGTIMGNGGMAGGFEPGTHMGDGTTTPGGFEPGTHMGDGTTTPGGFEPGTHMGTDPTIDPAPGIGPMGPGHMFGDMVGGEWYQEYAEQMAGHGFMSGFADGTFGGDQAVTRGQFAGIMARMMGLESVDGTTFSDTTGFWGATAIEALAQSGVVAGYANGAFGPYDDITRAQMAAMMDRAWEWMEQNGTAAGMGDAEMAQLREQMLQRLNDVQGHWAEDHIAHMFGLGVLQGDQSGMFHPQATTTRAQASAMMWRWYEALQ
ncbi:MAG: S-layer homology domain-containing protein [Thermoleophilia bacterium]